MQVLGTDLGSSAGTVSALKWPPLICFWTGSHGPGLAFNRVTLNFWLSCIYILSAGVLALQLVSVLGIEPMVSGIIVKPSTS